jgi:hypothetical protein
MSFEIKANIGYPAVSSALEQGLIRFLMCSSVTLGSVAAARRHTSKSATLAKTTLYIMEKLLKQIKLHACISNKSITGS